MIPQEEPCGPCDESLEDENGECPCDVDWPKLRTKDNHSIIRGQNAVSLFEHEAEPLFGYESTQPRITSHGSTAANRSMSAEPPAEPGAEGPPPTYVRSFQPAVAASHMAEPSPSPVQLLHPETPIPLGDDPAVWGGIIRETPQVIHLANQTPLLAVPESDTVVLAQEESFTAPQIESSRSSITVEESETEMFRLEPVPLDPSLLVAPGTIIEIERDHTKPVMSYTNIFDGKNENVVQLLRDYVEIQGDKRSGGWEGYMQRTDDYIKFCCHMMIVDMLSLHGGALRTKVWLKIRKNP
jgi:hypothetical protein